MKTAVMAALGLLALGSQAHATGGFSCTASDETLRFQIDGVVPHGFGSPVIEASGNLAYQPTDGQPPISQFTFGKSNISQYWNRDGVLNLVIYKESYEGDTYETMVVVETRTKDEGETYLGTYKVSTSQQVNGDPFTHSAEGEVRCSQD